MNAKTAALLFDSSASAPPKPTSRPGSDELPARAIRVGDLCRVGSHDLLKLLGMEQETS